MRSVPQPDLTGPSGSYRHFATKDDGVSWSPPYSKVPGTLGHGVAQAAQVDDPTQALEILCSTFVESALKDPDLMYIYFYEARHMPPEARASLELSAEPYLANYER